MAESTNEETEEAPQEIVKVKKKQTTKETDPGIIYLSRIPQFMSVKKIRHIFESYGELGRIFLQPDEKAPENKKNRVFTEGWIEFTEKKVARQVAFSLNNKQIGGKRRNPWFEEIWNIKYLPKFKWAHLNERLAYERAVHKQRLRTEISQVKKETNFYKQNVEKSEILDKIRAKHEKKGTEFKQRGWEYTQKVTEEEFLEKKRKRKSPGSAASSQGGATSSGEGPAKKKQKPDPQDSKKAGLNMSFLQRIFSGGANKQSEQAD